MQNEGSENAPRNPRLCGFARIEIGADETVEAEILIDKKQLLVINEEGEAVSEGSAALYVGVSQPDEKSVQMCGVRPVIIE